MAVARNRGDFGTPGDLGGYAVRVCIAVGVAALALALLALVWQTSQVLLLTFAGVLFAVFLGGLSEYVRRLTGTPSGLSFASVALTLLGLLGLTIYLTGSQVASQVYSLTEQLPEAVSQLEENLSRYPLGREAIRRASEADEYVSRNAGAIRQGAASAATGALAVATGVIVIVFLTLYLAYEPDPYLNGIVRLAPPGRRRRVREILLEIRDTLWNWVLAKLCSMAVVGVATSIGLSLMGMPAPLALGLIAGLTAFVPNFGPLVGFAPAFLLALPQGSGMALGVLALYVGIQTFESYLITPLIEYELVKIPPGVVILAQVFLGVLTGILGVLLASPIVATGMVLVRELYIQDTLGDDAGDDKPGGG